MISMLAAALLAAGGPLEGQRVEESGAVSGEVVTEGTGAPLPTAAVTIRSAADSTVIATSLAGSGGRFLATGLPLGTYLVEIAILGHAPVVREDVRITAPRQAVDLGTIVLRPTAIALEGVTATGERSAVSLAPDRSIYNVREMPVVQGGFATDALRAIPELEVDVDDNVRARGGAPQIYLDGRPLLMQGSERIEFLRSLRADRIDRIEYIPNPSSRFEADGESGIVNIVLRRDNTPGLSGSVAANAGTRGTQGVSSRLNYQVGPLTFFGGGSFNLSQSNMSTFDLRRTASSTAFTYLERSADRERDGITGSGDVTAEMKLSERSTVWGIVRGSLGDAEEHGLVEFVHLDDGRAVTDRFERENLTDNGNDGAAGSLGFRRVVEAQRNEFSAEIRYDGWGSRTSNRNLHYAQTLEGDRLAGDPGLTSVAASASGLFWSGQADLSKPLGAETRIDIGYRANLRDNTRRQEGRFYTPEGEVPHDFIDRFRYIEDSHAGYVNLDHRIGSVTLQGGMRAERDKGRGTANDLDTPVLTHTGFFPSANVAYDAGDGRQLRVSYSNRIQRPHAENRNPINTSPTDPYNRNVGNPGLTPADLHTFSMDASWSGALGTLRLSPFLIRATGLLSRVRSVDGNGIATVMPRNIATTGIEGMNLNASLRQLGRFSGTMSVNVQHLAFDVGDIQEVRSDEFTNWNANANITTTITPTLRVQTTGGYSSGGLTPYGRQSANRQVNVALTQRVYGDRGTITLSIVDPFDLSRNTVMTRNEAHQQTERTSDRIRRATLSVNYNFGRPPQSNRRVVADDPSSGGGMGGP